MNIKLVALDMDGTLLNSKKEKPAEFIPWVEKHPEIKVVLLVEDVLYFRKRLYEIRDKLTFIAENGGLVFEKGEVIFKDEMDKQDVLNCIDLIEKVPYATAVVCGAKSAYVTEPDEEIRYNVEMYYERNTIVKDLREADEK